MDQRGGDASPADKALARDLALGVVRRLNTLDWALSPLTSRPFASLDPAVRAALRLGAFQLLFAMDRFPAYAALNETVPLAGPKAKGLVNAVLRALQRQGLPPWPDDPATSLSLKHSHPEWLVRRWLARWGTEAEKVLEAGNAEPPFSLRVNRRRATPEALAASLRGEGHEAVSSPISPDGVRVKKFFSLSENASFGEGLFSVQDEAAQLAVAALDPRPGETVLDACAGVGGKTAHAAERLDGRGRVVAVDTDGERLSLSRRNVRRLGLDGVETVEADVRRGGWPESDRVLVDAPCSGLGTVRRRPDIKWAVGEEDVAHRLPALQGEILRAAAQAVKPGGVLVYATCTTEPEENEGVVGAFLAERGDFAAEAPSLPAALASPDFFVRLRPDLHGTDGFFIALLRRK